MDSVIMLRDPEVMPSNEVVAQALAVNIYCVYVELMQVLTNAPYSLNADWSYYKDGKAWLCKISFKKKTVCWLSIWNDCVKVTFYFNHKNQMGVYQLNISEAIMRNFEQTKTVAKLFPLIFDINDSSQLHDLFEVLMYKKTLF